AVSLSSEPGMQGPTLGMSFSNRHEASSGAATSKLFSRRMTSSVVRRSLCSRGMTGAPTLGRSSIEAPRMQTGAERTLQVLGAQVGRPLGDVETPVAVVDLDRLE